jgi:MFS family permease
MTYSVTLTLSALGGFLQGGAYTLQAIYISECSNDLNRAMYFGLSYSIVNSTQVIGSLLGALLIEPLDA